MASILFVRNVVTAQTFFNTRRTTQGFPMRFMLPTFAVGLLVALPLAAGDDGLTGHWKLSINARGLQTWWLVHMESKDGKLSATIDAVKGAPKAKIESIKQDGDALSMKIRAGFVLQGRIEEVVFD